MKKLLLILTIVMSLFTPTFAKSHIYKNNLSIKTYNTILKRMVENDVVLIYVDNDNSILMHINDGYSSTLITLDSALIVQINQNIKKYYDWNKLASKQRVKIEKDIDTLNIKNAGWTLGRGNDIHFSKPIKIITGMFSQSENHHQFTLVIDKLINRDNKYIVKAPMYLYLDYSMAVKFENAFKWANIKKFIKSLSKKEQILNQFN